MRVLCFLFFLCLANSVGAQIGVSGFYNLNRITSTDESRPEFAQPDASYEVQVNYWFRLPNHRVEFAPTVYYGSGDFSDLTPSGKFQEVGFQFEVNIYPFDFLGDCDCPTFGKQGPHLEKGFFIQLAPGVARRDAAYDVDFLDDESLTTFVYGGGIGLDIGITNFLTLTPLATVRTGTFPFEFEFSDVNGVPLGSTNPRQTAFQLGLQASFRFDHKRY